MRFAAAGGAVFGTWDARIVTGLAGKVKPASFEPGTIIPAG